jgi:hypothetical protein
MENLYWMRRTGQTVNLAETEFGSEQELERYLFEHQDLLENIYVIKRQVRSGTGRDIPDMVGIDQDGNVCVIELKNDTVTEDVLPQVLQYAIWAETSPDSIKAMWLEADDRPEEMEVDWDNADVRIVVIGPRFRNNVLRMTDRIGYDIDLLRVARFVDEEAEETFILAERLEPEEKRRIKTAKGKGEWGRQYYEEEHGEKATAEMYQMADQIQEIIDRHGWNIRMKPTKYYLGFKYGNVLAFMLHWGGVYAWKVKVQVTQDEAEAFEAENWDLQRYEEAWHQAVFRRTSPDAKAVELEALLASAYARIRGKA